MDKSTVSILEFSAERNRDYTKRVQKLTQFCNSHAEQLSSLIPIANSYKEEMSRLDPVIQEFTKKICPYCGTVCCRQKFGLPNGEDIVTFWALGITPPEYDRFRDLNGPCQYLTSNGCHLPRINRPFRCTWYFCEAITVQIEISPPKVCNNFIDRLKALIQTRQVLINTFRELVEYKS